MSKAFPIKFGIYSLVFVYILLDLFVFEGPLKQLAEKKAGKVRSEVSNEMDQKEIAAYVYRYPIYLSQLDYYMRCRLQQSGIDAKQLSANELASVRGRFLDQMITELVFRIRTDANHKLYQVDKEDVAKAMQRFMKRFESEQQAQNEMSDLAIASEEEMALRFEAILQQGLYLEELLEKNIQINESSLKEFYNNNLTRFSIPKRRRVRQVFISHLEHGDEGKEKIEGILGELEGGTDFADLVKEYSEDLASKAKGGDLGWLTKERCPVEVADWIFAEDQKEWQGKVKVIESNLGWHLLEITDWKTNQVVPFEQVRDELYSVVRSKATIEAVGKFTDQFKAEIGVRRRYKDPSKDTVSIEGKKCRIEIFEDIFQRPLSNN